MELTDWLLTSGERGNAATRLDDRRRDRAAWSEGNHVRPLVHGATYFRALLSAIRSQRAGDLLLFTDWRGDPGERLEGEGSEIGAVLGEAAGRGVIVKGLVWRSHLDRFDFSETENRHLGEEIEAAGGECLLDMRVRPGGSHHQKLVVLRHPGRPGLDIAFVGGIDLCHNRNDDAAHRGDSQSQPMAAAYGPHPPWHDVQLAIRGPAVGDLEAGFRERWEDPAPLSRSPLTRLRELIHREDTDADALPPQLPDPEPCGTHTVQVLRTYPNRLLRGYAYAPDGERSIARSYLKALRRARALIYVEDQYLWSPHVVQCFARALADNSGLRLIAVVPSFPEQDGRLTLPMNLIGRISALERLRRAGGPRVAVYGLENHAGTPVYVHAKVCVIDDVWTSVGSDNINLRSWTHDSELNCAVLDGTRDPWEPRDPGGLGDGARTFARNLRLELSREHLDRGETDAAHTPDVLCDPGSAFDAFAETAAALDSWCDRGQRGPRPPGRLRTYHPPRLSRTVKALSLPLYRLVVDPDGRPLRLRRHNSY
ncbi:phosphatidylserine/phosphatidylglycerophosphate/cardiolipin synthase-like enzyme [Streptomyces sp. SLBN-118]|uniref:phospholipase D family protein n=1 Tax=Streptomyces sp. SLBN-118 TaxID=2768454 RepID=UPI00114EC7B4|nr:phospholipase D family protein [Streptomyces sp. SLBN-118]TQK50129.1 phosphatidylserine/phosphatidylglycerophosphate/cardiolipin synthase-like enzyme [Streptomyces sp. SLBN-118]